MNNLSIFFRVFALINFKIKRFQCIMSSKAHAYRHHDDLTSTCLQLRFFSLPASTNHPHILHTHRWCWCNYIAPIHSSHYVKGIFSSDHSRVRSGVVGQTHGCARPIFLMVLKRSRSHFFSSNTNSVVKLLVIRL